MYVQDVQYEVKCNSTPASDTNADTHGYHMYPAGDRRVAPLEQNHRLPFMDEKLTQGPKRTVEKVFVALYSGTVLSTNTQQRMDNLQRIIYPSEKGTVKQNSGKS